MAITLLDMGNTKKRNVRESIIAILSREYPLSIKKIFNKMKKEYATECTYQAVFKMIQDMIQDGIIDKSEMEYQLNSSWIKQMEDEISIIKHNYNISSENNGDSTQKEKIEKFIVQLGPKIKEYIGTDEACVVGITGQGYKFSTALWKYLSREGIKANFIELNKYTVIRKEPIKLNKVDFENRKVIITDSEISGGTMYRLSNEIINSVKKSFKIKEIKYTVYKDAQSIADFSVEKG